MTDHNEQPAITAGEEAKHRHLDDDLRALFARGLVWVDAEIELQKARAGFAASNIKGIAILGGLAVLFVFFALVALTVGLVIALTPLLGAIVATLVVCAGLLVAALLCGLVAANRWKRMTTALANPRANDG